MIDILSSSCSSQVTEKFLSLCFFFFFLSPSHLSNNLSQQPGNELGLFCWKLFFCCFVLYIFRIKKMTLDLSATLCCFRRWGWGGGTARAHAGSHCCVAAASIKPQQISNNRADRGQISPLFRIHRRTSCLQIPYANIPVPFPLISSSSSSFQPARLSPQSHHLSLSLCLSLSHTHTLHLRGVCLRLWVSPLFFFFFSLLSLRQGPGPEVASVSTIRPYNGW